MHNIKSCTLVQYPLDSMPRSGPETQSGFSIVNSGGDAAFSTPRDKWNVKR